MGDGSSNSYELMEQIREMKGGVLRQKWWQAKFTGKKKKGQQQHIEKNREATKIPNRMFCYLRIFSCV